jgi:hypothetical protein
MTTNDSNEILAAFSKLCDELSGTVGLEECHYWLFERGYNAALEQQAKHPTPKQVNRQMGVH